MSHPEFAPKMVFADRFTVESVAGRGAMGVVYRARDERRDGAKVALKVLRTPGQRQPFRERFSREAYMLSELRHPGIVAYIDHGVTPEGDPFLAMEWLEGEDLGQRLDHGGLTLVETVHLFRAAADALSAAHRRGFVHRDLKPENIFLRDGRPEVPILLDFGVGRLPASDLTAAGVAVGTPLYMAPEQARGDQDIGPSADVFALGCVMYKCLIGRTPFPDEGHPTVVLARILRGDVPQLRTLRPSMPETLDHLLQRMLAKEPARRPKDAHALLEELNALGSFSDEPAPEKITQVAIPLSIEQQLVSVILVVQEELLQELQELPEDTARRLLRMRRQGLASALRGRFDACVEVMRDGSMIVTLAQTERMTATDQAAQAARCALFLRENLASPEASSLGGGERIAITTGRGIVSEEHLPNGEVFDRANGLLHRSTTKALTSRDSSPGILVDDMTAHLLDSRFQLRHTDSGVFVLDSELDIDEARPLLGKPTPCVGRERELTALQLLLDDCCEESVARLAVVIAAPGIGKSRLRHEFLRRVHHNNVHGVDVWFGRGDPTRAGAPYDLLTNALRRLIDVREGEDLAEQQRKLGERVRRHVPPDEAAFVTEFLGELCGIPFASETSPKLMLARADPRAMVSQILGAFVAFVRAECDAHPVLIVLEDLHWSDALTVRVIDASLRDCHDKRVMVLALARPEVKELYPKLWTERKRRDFVLDGLSKRASEQLVRRTLEADVAPETVARIVEQAAGNALFLEELIRFVSEGPSDSMPDTVLAMLQARLQRLEPEVRRVLRAASVYGATFWRGGVLALLGESVSMASLDERLEELVHRELITQNSTTRLLSDIEYAFRHALVREAAHGLLTDEDREAGHRAAAAFLQSMGERDPSVLAEHHALGHEMEQAATLYARAARKAADFANLREATQLAERGIACGATGELLATLHNAQGRALLFECDFAKAYACVSEALPLLRRGSDDWCYAVGTMLGAAPTQGRYDDVILWGDTLRTTDPELAALGVYFEALCVLVAMMTWMGHPAEVQTYLARIDEMSAMTDNVFARAVSDYTRAHASWYLSRDPWSVSTAAARAETTFAPIGYRRLLSHTRAYGGASLAHMGSLDAGEEMLRSARADALVDGDRITTGIATTELAMALVDREDEGARDEAEQLLRSYVCDDQAGDEGLRGQGHSVLAQILLERGDFEAAERQARRALSLMTLFIVVRPYADAALVTILLRSGRLAEARAHADVALAHLDQLGGGGFAEVRLRFAAFEAYAASGDDAGANQLLQGAVEQVRIRADAIADPTVRMGYLTKNATSRRVLEEASKRLES
ncbi:protein kinase [Pendulispora rubella]|uniref:Protein kinase n=1 Tax=Pendulispora rubella TaxID=2741070 RepID=A0ABZ2KT93_9BACT